MTSSSGRQGKDPATRPKALDLRLPLRIVLSGISMMQFQITTQSCCAKGFPALFIHHLIDSGSNFQVRPILKPGSTLMRASCCVRFFERPSSTATWASVQSKHVEVPVEFNFVSDLSIAACSLYQRRIRIRSLLISIGSSRRMISELHRPASDKDLMGPDGTNWTDAYTTLEALALGRQVRLNLRQIHVRHQGAIGASGETTDLHYAGINPIQVNSVF
jgi:hypothetical protein